ncbi:MAG: putative DNA-binding domain-containing protein [Gammaproteobacteria bacterium]|nr:putative DNA-binding domain-containing protein [Gammaproteobacteria bacterium]
MSGLRDLQFRFSAGIFDSRRGAITEHVRANGLTGSRRLQVYRNNVFTGFTEALRAVYPVIERLTGEEFFRALARDYITKTPSSAGNLHEFGSDFGEFLVDYPKCARFPYFSDVARLEWAYHEAYHAGDRAPLNLGKLAEIDPAHYAVMVFELHPAVRLLRSRYPVKRVWEVNQPHYPHEPVVDLDAGEARVLVHRPRWEVELHSLDIATFEFLDCLGCGHTLGVATDAALTVNDNFDLDACLITHVENAVIVDVAPSAVPPRAG